MRICISAYAASPYQGSEPGVGWGFVCALARYHDLWVIVEEEKFRADIERYLAKDPDFSRRVRFFYIRKKRNRWLRRIWPPSYYWYYRRWQRDAYNLANRLNAEVHFDIVHQLTMVGFREPGYLWKLDVPFVWGPIGGMGIFPWRFLFRIGFYGAFYYAGYNLFNIFQMNLLSRPRIAARTAGSALISATSENQAGAQMCWATPSKVISEVGISMQEFRPDIRRRVAGESLKIVWAGRAIPGKALNLGLHALAKMPISAKWELAVLGDGFRKGAWMKLAKQLGIADKCSFYGQIQRESVLAVMLESHLMLITSLRDLTSMVAVEALACGLPIVCLDHCGFADLVDETCGKKVPITSWMGMADGLAAAIQSIECNDELRQLLAKGALEKAQKYDWQNKAMLLNNIYLARLREAGHIEEAID